jgi:hypothetical protein
VPGEGGKGVGEGLLAASLDEQEDDGQEKGDLHGGDRKQDREGEKPQGNKEQVIH